MAIYTISLNLFENLQSADLSYLACILFCFTNEEHPAKLAVDKKHIILSKYKDFSRHGDIIRIWIDMLSNLPSNIERIDVDLEGEVDTEQMCLALCSRTNGPKQMIVYSLTSLKSEVDDNCCICHNGHRIKVLDRDEAKRYLNEQQVVYISNSQVAGRDIKKSQNTNNNG